MSGFASIPPEGTASLRCQSQGATGEPVRFTRGPITEWYQRETWCVLGSQAEAADVPCWISLLSPVQHQSFCCLGIVMHVLIGGGMTLLSRWPEHHFITRRAHCARGRLAACRC